MQLWAAMVQNAAGGPATIFVQTGGMAGHSVTVADGLTSAAITGALLTIDVQRPNLHLSFDFIGQFPAVTANAAGSPYRMTITATGGAHPAYTLNIRSGNVVVASRRGVVVAL